MMASELSVEAAPMTKELLLHLKQHNQKSNCNKCRWATFYRKWATALPLVPPDLECAALGMQNGENSWVVFPQQWRVWLRSLPKCDVS